MLLKHHKLRLYCFTLYCTAAEWLQGQTWSTAHAERLLEERRMKVGRRRIWIERSVVPNTHWGINKTWCRCNMSYSLFFRPFHLSSISPSFWLSCLSPHLLTSHPQSGCCPVRYRTPVCLRPIWKIFAHPLKCMFRTTSIPFLLCFSLSLSPSPLSPQWTRPNRNSWFRFCGRPKKKKKDCKPPEEISMDRTNI